METLPSQSSTEKVEQFADKDDQNVHIFNFMGYKIYVGRNAISNERLIVENKKEHKHCFWFHAVGAKGAHVVLCLGNKVGVPDEIVLRRAAGLASRFSQLKGPKVVYSELQDVYKATEGTVGVWHTWKRYNVIEV